MGSKQCAPGALATRIGCWQHVTEEVDINRPRGAATYRSSADLENTQLRARQGTQAARLADGDRQRGIAGAGHWRKDDRQLDSKWVHDASIRSCFHAIFSPPSRSLQSEFQSASPSALLSRNVATLSLGYNRLEFPPGSIGMLQNPVSRKLGHIVKAKILEWQPTEPYGIYGPAKRA
jgi:hypothetical protein